MQTLYCECVEQVDARRDCAEQFLNMQSLTGGAERGSIAYISPSCDHALEQNQIYKKEQGIRLDTLFLFLVREAGLEPARA